MRCLALSLATLLLALLTSVYSYKPPTIRTQHDKLVVCYVASWAAYRPGKGQFQLENLRPELCTHIIYAFAGLNASASAITSLDPFADLEENYGKGLYRKMTGLKRNYPNLKVSLAIGGWNEGSANYSALAASPNRRNTFVKSVFNYLRKYNFDGLDLDWEFPGKRGGSPYDRENFVHLVKELSDALRGKNLLLTAAISADKATIDAAYDIPEVSKYLDYIHVMSYDYHGSWNRQVLPNAPLKCNDGLCVEDTLQYLLKLKAPREKLVLGLPMYGRTFILVSEVKPNDNIIGAPTLEKGFKGPFTGEDGLMGYNEICSELQDSQQEWQVKWDKESSTPYAYNGDKAIVFDNPKSITQKVEYAIELKLAGVMVWSIDTDDFHGDCAKIFNDKSTDLLLTGFNYPIMTTINMALAKPSIEEINNNEVVPPGSASIHQSLRVSSILIIYVIFNYLV